MIFAINLKITAGTVESAPIVQEFGNLKGNLNMVTLSFPLNNNNYGKVWFEVDGLTVIPSNAQVAKITGNDVTIVMKPRNFVEGNLSIKGYNLDGFDHTITGLLQICEQLPQIGGRVEAF